MSAVAAVLEIGGAAVPRLMERIEERMSELASGHGPALARYAGDTIAAGGKRLRPLLVCIAAGVPPPETEGLVRAAVAVELVHGRRGRRPRARDGDRRPVVLTRVLGARRGWLAGLRSGSVGGHLRARPR